jgi:EAL domain-containing protein (putative c-di-GMP-specific phosphodiesterase class I)
MQVWKEAGLPPIAVSVNVSARQFQHSELSKSISNILDETRLGPQYLRLELTESAIMADVPRAKLTLQELSELGVRLSIDDFGTGYSSLSELRWLPLQALKIDQSFVRDLPKDKDAAAIALAIIAMAHSLGIAVVAEGVETEAQLAFLKDHHCDEVQGYLVSPPVPAPQLVQFLENAGLRTRRDKFQLSDGRASCGDI